MTERINGYNIHPMASAYPLLPEKDLEALADDIKKNGQLEPVLMDRKTGLVIDGRNRLAACGMVGVDPTFVWERFETNADVLSAILSRNHKRRHMTKAAQCIALGRALRDDQDVAEACARMQRGHPVGPVEEEALRLREKVRKHRRIPLYYCYIAVLVGCQPGTSRDAISLDTAHPDLGAQVLEGKISSLRARKKIGHSVPNKTREYLESVIGSLKKELEEAKRAPLADPVDIQRAKEKNRVLTAHNKELIDRLALAEARSLLHEEVSSVHIPRVPIADRPVGGRREATAVCVISDGHVEERVDYEETNGRNEYNPDICRARFEKLGQGLLWHLDLFRSQYDIPALLLPILGDMISGQIHEELIGTNYLSQVPSIRLARDCLAQIIHRVLDETDISQVTVPCVVGNHSRLTKKQAVKKAAENSFELVLYTELEDSFRGEPRVRFVVAPGKMIYLEVYDFVLRFVHGDQVTYNGGIGGVTIPLNKKINGWDTERKADLTVMGHHHTWLPLPHAVINGSIVGYNEYAKHIGARYEPPQQAFFLIDSKRGYRHSTRLFVDSKDKER